MFQRHAFCNHCSKPYRNLTLTLQPCKVCKEGQKSVRKVYGPGLRRNGPRSRGRVSGPLPIPRPPLFRLWPSPARQEGIPGSGVGRGCGLGPNQPRPDHDPDLTGRPWPAPGGNLRRHSGGNPRPRWQDCLISLAFLGIPQLITYQIGRISDFPGGGCQPAAPAILPLGDHQGGAERTGTGRHRAGDQARPGRWTWRPRAGPTGAIRLASHRDPPLCGSRPPAILNFKIPFPMLANQKIGPRRRKRR